MTPRRRSSAREGDLLEAHGRRRRPRQRAAMGGTLREPASGRGPPGDRRRDHVPELERAHEVALGVGVGVGRLRLVGGDEPGGERVGQAAGRHPSGARAPARRSPGRRARSGSAAIAVARRRWSDRRSAGIELRERRLAEDGVAERERVAAGAAGRHEDRVVHRLVERRVEVGVGEPPACGQQAVGDLATGRRDEAHDRPQLRRPAGEPSEEQLAERLGQGAAGPPARVARRAPR